MFHNHATSRHIYITTDKLHLNKLSQSTTHLSCVKPLSTQQCGTPCRFNKHAPKLLQMLLAAFVSSKSQTLEVASELPHANIAKRRLMQVREQLGSASGRPIQFFGCCERPCSGDRLTEVSASRKKYDTPAVAVRL
jgi:hypothetical protein